jgi:isoleucyl-tRNA synthetase
VHLALLPEAGPGRYIAQDPHALCAATVFLTRGLREQTRLKTRQPLARILVATTSPQIVEHVRAMKVIIVEECNIKDIDFIAGDSDMLRKRAKAISK